MRIWLTVLLELKVIPPSSYLNQFAVGLFFVCVMKGKGRDERARCLSSSLKEGLFFHKT